MNYSEKQDIHTLFETENFSELYQIQSEVINQMLFLDSQEDFEDFLKNENFIDEAIFWLHYSVIHKESLLISGYDKDVTQKVTDFLKKQLPNDLFRVIQKNLQTIYVDIDAQDTLKEHIRLCNQNLTDTGYFLQLDFDDTYYAGVYFLSVISL